jgi:hypothetical protein
VDAATDEPEKFQARLVGPVGVLQGHDSGTAGIPDALEKQGQEFGDRDVVKRQCAAGEGLEQIVERRERTGRGKRIAPAPDRGAAAITRDPRKRSRTLVLPMPASPAISTSRPSPARAALCASASLSSASSRSISSISGPSIETSIHYSEQPVKTGTLVVAVQPERRVSSDHPVFEQRRNLQLKTNGSNASCN